VLLVIGGLSLVAPGRPLRAQNAPDAASVDSVIARGVAFLRTQQERDGGWTYSYNLNHRLGITALAGLALVENGVKSEDESLVRAEKVVRALAIESDQTYDLSLAILFLSRVRRGPTGNNDPLVRRLADRLAEGGGDGFWGYKVPVEPEDAPNLGRSRRGMSRRQVIDPDNSNTQFALLGIWAAGRHGFDSNATLAGVDTHFRTTPNSDGRWGYAPGDRGRDSMTCAGVMGLAIASARPALAERQTARSRGAALASDPVFAAGLRAIGQDARSIGTRSDIYYLWSLERVCVALGLRDLDGFDWYGAGARELVRRQQEDGGWPNEIWGRLPNTCLSLLFLRKANLAFELDRVLRLPSAGGPLATAAPARPPEPAGPATAAGDGDATVLVTGASDTGFPEISVDFEVKRPDGSFVLDAPADDFKVSEDGVAMPILRLQPPTNREARPITVVLVLDRSRSMEEEDRIVGLKKAVSTFLDGLPAGSKVAVVAFGSDVTQLCPFTDDLARVREAVERLTPAGATRYYDAVAESLELIRGQEGRRAILAMTDGEDTFSQDADLDAVIFAARKTGVPIHTLGLGTEEEIESGALKRLADSTRGQYYPARQADQLRSIYEEIAQRLRSSYTLVYRTDRVIPDGTLRPVRVIYRAARQAGETAVFIPGMVVPAPGWSGLFLALVAALAGLAVLPGWLRRGRQKPMT
jgi:VWFA-related protein